MPDEAQPAALAPQHGQFAGVVFPIGKLKLRRANVGTKRNNVHMVLLAQC